MLDVIIADDDTLARGGMVFFLSTMEDIRIVETVMDGLGVVDAVQRHPDAVLVLDMGLPGRHGLEVLRELKAGTRQTRIIVLTGFETADLLQEGMDAGADAMLTKTCDTDELYAALMAVRCGETYIGPSARKVLDHAETGSHAYSENGKVTSREKQVMLMIADGQSATEISCHLGIAEPTVRKHRENLMQKLNLHNTADITSYVIKRGLHLE